MCRRRILGFLGAFLCAGWVGCASSSRVGYPDDPLLISKKPVDGKAPAADPPMFAFAEPAPPPLPPQAFCLSGRHRKSSPASGSSEAVAAKDGSEPAAASKETSASQSQGDGPGGAKTPSAIEALPVSRRKNPGNFAHAPDYTWLQGTLDLAGPRPQLVYCESAEKDIWGGKVALENDPRLAQFRSGDVIRVEGEILTEGEMPSADSSAGMPIYRIKGLRPVRRQP
jgi:hypothetical protein